MSNFNQVYVQGIITNIAEDASSIYLIGNDIMAQPISLGSPYNRVINSTGASSSSIDVNGSINGHVVHNNYLYIWGNFTKVNGVNRYNLAKLNAETLELDVTFNPTSLYTPYSRPYLCGLVLSNYLYLGYESSGSYTGLVEVNLTNGSSIRQLGTTSFLDGIGLSRRFDTIATDGENIFVGGSFAISNSTYQTNHLAKINRVTGEIDTNFVHNLPFSVVVNNNYSGQYISSLAADSTGLYVGGSFNGFLKKLNKSNGTTIWTIETLTNDSSKSESSIVYISKIKIDPTSYYLYACGTFDKHNNQSTGGLLKVNASTGLKNDSFLQQFSLTSLKNSRGSYGNDSFGRIVDFGFDNNNNLYISGQFTEITGGTSIYVTTHSTINFAKIDTIYGRPLNTFTSNGTNYGALPKIDVINNNKIFIYGIDTYGGRKPNKILKLLKETGLEDTTFNINFEFTPANTLYYNTAIYKFAIYQQSLYVYQEYLSKVNTVSVNKIAKINLETKSVDTTFFSSSNFANIYTMHADENALYIGGSFLITIGQNNHRSFARLNTNTGNILNDYWVNLNLTDVVYSIKNNGNDLYIAGSISQFQSSTSTNASVNRIVKFDKLTGTKDSNFSIASNVTGAVTNMRLTDNSLYASGSMRTSPNNVAKPLMKFNLNSGITENLMPYGNVTISNFEIDLQKNYLFVQIYGGTIDIVDGTTGTFTTSQLPQTTYTNGGMLVSDGKLYTSSTGSSFYGDLTTYSTSTNLLAVSGPDNIILNPSQVLENSSENTEVGILSVNGGTAPFTFQFISGNGDTDNSSFIIQNNIVKVASGVNLNYELKNIYSIRIKVTDFENYVFEKNLTINIINVNETPVDIALSNSSIFENSPINTVIGSLSGIDPDSNPLTFSIISGNDKFNINGNTLRSSIVFDYENVSTHNITIRATDSGGLYVDKQFTINILSVNEAPNNILLSSNTIVENSPVNTIIGILTGTDSDSNDILSFSVIVGTSNFNINGNELRSSVAFDYETSSSQPVTIRATDSGGLYVDKQFTINVLNVNEAPTSITISNSSILENNAIGDVIGTLSATDPENNSVTFSLDTVNDYASFSIAGNQLKAATVFNRELKNLYTIRVIATDTNNNTFAQTLNISIGNRVEPPLNISLSSTQILENNLTDAIIGTLSAIDPEGGTISFSVVAGADKFNIISVGGIWKLRASVSFDYATQAQHSVTVRATNANSEYADKTFSIEILEYIEPETVNLTNQQYTLADSGKAYVETIYDPTVVGLLIDGAALVPGSVVINSNSGQKYLKLTGNMTDYYVIPLNAKPEWVWSTSGYAIWQII